VAEPPEAATRAPLISSVGIDANVIREDAQDHAACEARAVSTRVQRVRITGAEVPQETLNVVVDSATGMTSRHPIPSAAAGLGLCES
jgi:hypothetical protein